MAGTYEIGLVTLLALLIAVLVSGFALRTANVALEKRTIELSAANALLQQQSLERVQAENAMRESQEQLNNYLTRHDALTGLPNRNFFRDRLTHAMARAKRNGLMMAMIVLDLDRFKEINDTLGHTAGDKVLQAVAKVMRES
ncbi:MAG: GGDEF domain-containing protein, partial [Burkholderiales bacterium]|nr:GGDEF domain-containing protein [Burkholderiales bacterium]